jgi:hypothetical protein
MKIRFGIPTYNRKNLIELTSKSLYNVIDINKVDIIVYDDNSFEFDIDYLTKIYHTASDIKVSETNNGADYNTAKMYYDFYNSDYDYLFVADSDLIYNRNILSKIYKIIQLLQLKSNLCLVSLFHTLNHKIVKSCGDFYIKNNVGSAGCLISKRMVEFIFEWFTVSNFSDNMLSRLMALSRKIILTTNKSYVQHLGLFGQNSNLDKMNFLFDYGANFDNEDVENNKLIINAFEDFFNKKRKNVSFI